MLDLYDKVCSAYGENLYGTKIMGGGLLLANCSEVKIDESVIVVSFDPEKGCFSLEYRHREILPLQSESVPSDDVWERLRLYLAYKFGLYVKSEKFAL